MHTQLISLHVLLWGWHLLSVLIVYLQGESLFRNLGIFSVCRVGRVQTLFGVLVKKNILLYRIVSILGDALNMQYLHI